MSIEYTGQRWVPKPVYIYDINSASKFNPKKIIIINSRGEVGGGGGRYPGMIGNNGQMTNSQPSGILK